MPRTRLAYARARTRLVRPSAAAILLTAALTLPAAAATPTTALPPAGNTGSSIGAPTANTTTPGNLNLPPGQNAVMTETGGMRTSRIIGS
jgi:hypothetical protein